MKKRLLAVLMAATAALVCVFSFSACGDDAEDSKKDSSGQQNGQDNPNDTTEPSGTGTEFTDFVMPENGFDTTEQVEITLYHTMGQALKSILDDACERFKELYPNIKVQLDRPGSYDDVQGQIISDLTKGKQPNIAFCYPDHVAIYNQFGAIQTLDGFLPGSEYSNMKVVLADGTEESLCLTAAQKDDFIQAYYGEGYMFDDGSKMYTLPFAKSTEVLYYNKTFFDEHNLTPPTTWDEMEEVCKTIKELDPVSTPLGIDSESDLFITLCEQYDAPYTSTEAGNHFLFDNATTRGFVQEFKTMYDNGYFTTRGIEGGAYTSSLLLNQRSYMSIGSSAGTSNYKNSGFEVGIAPIPQVNPDNPKTISLGPSLCIFKQDDPQEVLASWLFAKFLTTDVEFSVKYSMASGHLPVSKTAHQVYGELVALENGYDDLTFLSFKIGTEMSQSYFVSPAFIGSGRAYKEVGDLLINVFTCKKTIDKAFEDAIAECQYVAGSTEED